MNKRINLNGIPLDLLTKDQILAKITYWLETSDKPRQIVTLNALMLMTAKTDPPLAEVIRKADLVITDGFGVAAAVQRAGYGMPYRVPGVELIPHILNWCSLHHRNVCFYGGTPKVAARLQQILPQRWPGMLIHSIRDGYTSTDVKKVILERPPDLLLAGLGTPAQELFIASLLKDLRYTVGIGVGGSFEILAEMKREAPPFIRKNGLEWLFRILQDPRRVNRLPMLLKFWREYLK